MGFTRDPSSLSGFLEGGVEINAPAFVSWDRDVLAQGTDWGLGQGWQLNINADGSELAFKYGSEVPWKMTSDGEATMTSLATTSLKLTILSSLPDVAPYQLGEVVNVLGYLYVKQDDPS
jgi:hypothetical protein